MFSKTVVIGEYLEFIYCACGCKKTRPLSDKYGRVMRYIGHHRKGSRKVIHNVDFLAYYIDAQGYRHVFQPDYYSANKKGYVIEHRFLYEVAYNCCLLDHTDIHHKNGIKTDNRLSNLEAMNDSEHRKLHLKT